MHCRQRRVVFPKVPMSVAALEDLIVKGTGRNDWLTTQGLNVRERGATLDLVRKSGFVLRIWRRSKSGIRNLPTSGAFSAHQI
jgi:hypothetical protein